MSIASATAKILLFVFNLLFLITGLAVAVVALLVQCMLWQHATFVGKNLFTAPMVIVLIGIIICVISIFGCCGVIKENRFYLCLFSGLLFLLFVAELGVSAYGYIKSNDLQQIVLNNMEHTMLQYNKTETVTKSWDVLQTDFHCCGTQNATEWIDKMHQLPHSCCPELDVKAECKIGQNYKDGCYTVFTNFLSSKACQLATIAIGISMAQLLSVFVSFLLARHVNHLYEAV